MIRLAEVVDTFLPGLETQYAGQLLPGHRKALAAIQRCRTDESGTVETPCHDCGSHESVPLSCGHRFCPQCQHDVCEQWLQRQKSKLLPCDYFLVTFTLPEQLRSLVFSHQSMAYALLIQIAWQVLSEFGLRDKGLRGKLGAIAVLHTHSRALGFHPHVHIIVPAGAIGVDGKTWRTKSGNFLFPQKALAKVFRAKWFQAMKEQGWKVKADLPKEWVVDCKRVGNGEKALTYLGRYLYRGVLREKDILSCEDGNVTFRYTDNSGAVNTRTLEGVAFLWLLLHHVLPKGFRRSRDYGFLHGNNKRTIQLLYLVLRICAPVPKEKPPLCCKHCGGSVTIFIFPYPRIRKPPDGKPTAGEETRMQ